MVDINVYGAIGEDWFDEYATTSGKFAAQMEAAAGDDVTIHVNSGGGDVFDANTMAEVIRAYKGHVVASIEGLAASAASYFALTADEVRMGKNALLMIHNPWGYCQGESADMRRTADMLDKVRATIVNQYVSKTGMDSADIEGYMDAETWFDAEEAKELGFVDCIDAKKTAKACVSNEILAKYRHAPEGIARDADTNAGEPAATIDADNVDEEEPETGAVEGAAGAAARTVCVQGQFLTY